MLITGTLDKHLFIQKKKKLYSNLNERTKTKCMNMSKS